MVDIMWAGLEKQLHVYSNPLIWSIDLAIIDMVHAMVN